MRRRRLRGARGARDRERVARRLIVLWRCRSRGPGCPANLRGGFVAACASRFARPAARGSATRRRRLPRSTSRRSSSSRLTRPGWFGEGQIRRARLLEVEAYVSNAILESLHPPAGDESSAGGCGRSRGCGLRSALSVRAHRVSRAGWGRGPVVGVRCHVSGGPCGCHRLHRRHPRSGAVKPCPAGRFASPDGPGSDSPTGGRR